MKKFLLLGVLGLAILAGCAQQNDVVQKNSMTADQIFEKKQECAKYEKDIKKAVEEDNLLYQNRDYSHNQTLSEIFYSPKKNSCLYSVSVSELQDGKYCNFYKVFDFFSKEYEEIYLIFNPTDNTCNYIQSLEKYNEALKELKGE